MYSMNQNNHTQSDSETQSETPAQLAESWHGSDATAHNDAMDTLLNRRSIRRFESTPIPPKTSELLELAAQRAATSQFLNAWSAIRITDPALKQQLAEIGEQPYIAEAPLLYIFVLDQRRNAHIAKEQGIDVSADGFNLASSYRFLQAQNDAVLALHAMETAAESLGLGCVILGSVLNDIDRLITLLHLRQLTFPVLGLAIGKPAQQPTLKPRMPRSMQFFENAYPADFDNEEFSQSLISFDATVHQYYDLRHADRPVAAFSAQIKKVSSAKPSRLNDIGRLAPKQGFDIRTQPEQEH